MENSTAYLAKEGLEETLAGELKGITSRLGRLFIAEGPVQKVLFAQNIWYDLKKISFKSIGEAATALRGLGPLWAHYPTSSLRRAALIQEKLPFFKPKPVAFLSSLPTTPIGSWTLFDSQTLLCAPKCSSPFAHGEARFIETMAPPSRAYLKLWEILTRIGKAPQPNDRCLEIGASPGGWTWVLNCLGAHITAVDRAPLAPSVKCAQFLRQDAFSIKPEDFPGVTWVFSDCVCYPKKLLEWILPWLERDVDCVCTIKLQGEEDRAILREFEKIGELVHLYHNKHELTWFRPKRSTVSASFNHS